jgi:hypothetical protein
VHLEEAVLAILKLDLFPGKHDAVWCSSMLELQHPVRPEVRSPGEIALRVAKQGHSVG